MSAGRVRCHLKSVHKFFSLTCSHLVVKQISERDHAHAVVPVHVERPEKDGYTRA